MLRGTEALCGTHCGLSTHVDWDEALRQGLRGDPAQERPLRVLPLHDTQACYTTPSCRATPLATLHPLALLHLLTMLHTPLPCYTSLPCILHTSLSYVLHTPLPCYIPPYHTY